MDGLPARKMSKSKGESNKTIKPIIQLFPKSYQIDYYKNSNWES